MTDERQPRESKDLERESTPELDKETLKDLEPDQDQAEELMGASTGNCMGYRI
jgi:hypothetical protein